MSEPFYAALRRRDGIAISTVHVAFALSLILHALALWGWLPRIPMQWGLDDLGKGKRSGSLAVRIAPPPAPARPPQATFDPPSPPVMRAPPRAPRPAAAAPRPQPAPRVLALEQPSPRPVAPPREAPPAVPTPAVPAPPAVAPPVAAPSAPPAGDLASFIEARRRARGEVSGPPASSGSPPVAAETEQQRHNRIVAENLGLNVTPTFGAGRHGGGIFQVVRIGYDDAEFIFFGWNKDITRNSRQMIEVRRGNQASTEIAVVRKMISIIREHESGDFVWESIRLRRHITLSARLGDNAGLEDFILREFFPEHRSRN